MSCGDFELPGQSVVHLKKFYFYDNIHHETHDSLTQNWVN
ncbi:Uncharacterised protein [Chlamydia trachomatis]|nr:Uncharacterised protein [Chlamydia trachomatis]